MSNFAFTPTDIPGVQIVDVKAYGDARGYFMETYKAADFAAAGIQDTFVQDNQSGSQRGVQPTTRRHGSVCAALRQKAQISSHCGMGVPRKRTPVIGCRM